MQLTADEINALIAALKVQVEFNSANVNTAELKKLIEKLKECLND